MCDFLPPPRSAVHPVLRHKALASPRTAASLPAMPKKTGPNKSSSAPKRPAATTKKAAPAAKKAAAPSAKKAAASSAKQAAAGGKAPAAAAKQRGGKAATDPGEAAYHRLKPRLDQLPPDRVVQPRAPVSAAASFVLSEIAPRLADRGLRARFAALPGSEFEHGALDDLVPAAQAALWAQARLAGADAAVPGTRLPVELLSEAEAVRRQMLSVCEYHFRDEPRLAQQVADIRLGQGYLDLAQDLQRLGALYRAEHETLKQDLRFYKAKDAEAALHLSQRITSELRSESATAARQVAWQTWALLLDLYEEVARAGRFLLRQAGEASFPSLHAVARAPVRRPRPDKNPTPAPAPPAQPQ